MIDDFPALWIILLSLCTPIKIYLISNRTYLPTFFHHWYSDYSGSFKPIGLCCQSAISVYSSYSLECIYCCNVPNERWHRNQLSLISKNPSPGAGRINIYSHNNIAWNIQLERWLRKQPINPCKISKESETQFASKWVIIEQSICREGN